MRNGRPGTSAGRPHSCSPTRHGADWDTPVSLRVEYDERAISQAAAFPGDRTAYARSWARSTGWPTIPARPGRFPMDRPTSGAGRPIPGPV